SARSPALSAWPSGTRRCASRRHWGRTRGSPPPLRAPDLALDPAAERAIDGMDVAGLDARSGARLQGVEEAAMTEAAGQIDWRSHGVRIVKASELDFNTPQTPGMTRAAAINFAKAGASKLWAGTVN